MADSQRSDVAALRKATGRRDDGLQEGARGDRRRHGSGQGLAAQEGSRRRGKRAGRDAPTGRDRRAGRGRRRRARRARLRDRLRRQGRRLHRHRRRRSPASCSSTARRSSPSSPRRRDRRRARHPARGEARRERSSSAGSSRFETADGVLDGYKHVQNERGTDRRARRARWRRRGDAKAREVAHDVALHIASRGAALLTRDDVPRRRRREGA